MNVEFCKLGLAVIENEAQAVSQLSQKIGDEFAKACELLLACQGRIIVMGVGKSGHIARKISATLASTGSPAFFVSPGEAGHGDFGMITKDDVILALSNSGNNNEFITLIPLISRQGISMVSLTGNLNSPLAKASKVALDVGIEFEACPLGLAPTTSTTVSLVMGDALAVSLLTAKGFSSDDFALSHPAGALGRKLLVKTDELAHTGDAMPLVSQETLVKDALIEITEKKLGMAIIYNSNAALAGVFTDGDIRRTLNSGLSIQDTPIKEVMSKNVRTISRGTLATEALNLMQKNKITSLVIVNDDNTPYGVIHLHNLLNAGVA
jgi:arabinose-5-phosphate isomerase